MWSGWSYVPQLSPRWTERVWVSVWVSPTHWLVHRQPRWQVTHHTPGFICAQTASTTGNTLHTWVHLRCLRCCYHVEQNWYTQSYCSVTIMFSESPQDIFSWYSARQVIPHYFNLHFTAVSCHDISEVSSHFYRVTTNTLLWCSINNSPQDYDSSFSHSLLLLVSWQVIVTSTLYCQDSWAEWDQWISHCLPVFVGRLGGCSQSEAGPVPANTSHSSGSKRLVNPGWLIDNNWTCLCRWQSAELSLSFRRSCSSTDRHCTG